MPEEFTPPVDEAPAYSPEQQEQSGKKVDSLKASDDEDAGTTPLTQTLESVGEHFGEHGEIGEEQYDALEKLGLNRQYVDSYINGLAAQQTQMQNQLMGIAGGEEQYGEMMRWMNESLTADEVQAYDRVVESGDVEQMSLLIQGMAARFKSANPGGPQTQLQGQTVPGASGFRSKGEIMEAMNDPRYATDAAFREDVSRKMSLTADTVW